MYIQGCKIITKLNNNDTCHALHELARFNMGRVAKGI